MKTVLQVVEAIQMRNRKEGVEVLKHWATELLQEAADVTQLVIKWDHLDEPEYDDVYERSDHRVYVDKTEIKKLWESL